MPIKFKTALELTAIAAAILVFDLLVKNYLVFHIIAELFSICILFALFTITWNARKFLNNKYLLFVGIAACFIGILDLLHTLTYKGMNIIPSTQFYANQFWIATRFFESVVLLSGFLFLDKRYRININYLLILYTAVTVGIIISILYFKNFPVCFIDNVGQTPFKIYSEYVIISILIAALLVLIRKKKYFEDETYFMMAVSIVLTISSEFCFTLYIANYDYINKIGHVFKILSFYMIYKANIQNGFTKPIETFFRDLKISREKIKEYNEELEKQIATKNRFFSIIAHDLKNPFTILVGFTGFLLENHRTFSEKQTQDIIKNIHETSEDTYRLLENLLSWSRTQTNTMPFCPSYFNIMEVLDENVHLIASHANLKNIIIKKEYSSKSVWGDVEMIKTVVRNLLSNAVKFTSRNGSITVVTSTEGDFMKINVIDTGVGMPPEKIKSLFQLDKNSSTKGTENESGTGLGLILCAEFVKINHGQFFIESRINEGSSFSFTIPLDEESLIKKPALNLAAGQLHSNIISGQPIR